MMPRLKYKPIVCTHFNPLDPYDLHYNLNGYGYSKSSDSKYNEYCFSRGTVREFGFNITNINFKKPFTISIWLYHDFQDHWDENSGRIERSFGNLVGGYGSKNMLFGWGWIITSNKTIDCNTRIGFWDMNTNIALYPRPSVISYDKRWIHLEYARSENDHFYIFLDGELINDYYNSTFCNTDPGNNNIYFNTCAKYIGEVMATQHCLHTTSFTPFKEPYYWNNRYSLYLDENNQYGKEYENETVI